MALLVSFSKSYCNAANDEWTWMEWMPRGIFYLLSMTKIKGEDDWPWILTECEKVESWEDFFFLLSATSPFWQKNSEHVSPVLWFCWPDPLLDDDRDDGKPQTHHYFLTSRPGLLTFSELRKKTRRFGLVQSGRRAWRCGLLLYVLENAKTALECALTRELNSVGRLLSEQYFILAY